MRALNNAAGRAMGANARESTSGTLSARAICANDEYAFDPTLVVELEELEDVVGRHFRQPPEGLGNDNTPASHMWCTLQRPRNAL